MTTPAVGTLPCISKKLTIAKLKEEANCRGSDCKQLPKTNADLLHHLVDGLIRLKESKAWKGLETIKLQMQPEHAALLQQSAVNLQVEERKKEERECKKEKKATEERFKKRENEIAKQEAFHTLEFLGLHVHPMAQTSTLNLDGRARQQLYNCCGSDD
jgi:hypothetical protein